MTQPAPSLRRRSCLPMVLGGSVCLIGPHLMMWGYLLFAMAQGFEGVCKVHRPEPEACGMVEFLITDGLANPFIFTLGAMGSGAWCTVSAPVCLLVALIWWAVTWWHASRSAPDAGGAALVHHRQ
jgi:hypothetical protein